MARDRNRRDDEPEDKYGGPGSWILPESFVRASAAAEVMLSVIKEALLAGARVIVSRWG